MTNSMSLEQALQHIQAGKFSFGMVDVIQNHLDYVSTELAEVRAESIEKISAFEMKSTALELELLRCRSELDAARRETANMKIEINDLKKNEAHLKEACDARINECISQLKQSVTSLFDDAGFVAARAKQAA